MRENKKIKNSFIKRLEKDFITAMLEEIKHHPLNEIRISDLCKRTNYPRSTFYKYYYDLEDLFSDYLEHVWYSLNIQNQDDVPVIFDKILSYQESNQFITAIYRTNRSCDMFQQNMQQSLKKHLLKAPFLKEAEPGESIPSQDFIADYMIKMMELLMEYKSTMDQKSFRDISDHLLKYKAC